jgi:hypothetical protein
MNQVNNFEIKCRSLIISDNNIKTCDTVIENIDCEQSSIFCKHHLYMNRFYNDDIECCICYEKINKTIEIPLECGHIHHRKCLSKLNKDECPLCKKTLSDIEITFFKNKEYLITLNNEIGSDIHNLENVQGTINRRIPICQQNPIYTFFIIFMWFVIIVILILSGNNII